MEYIRILACKAMTTDEIWVRILIYNDCGTEKFLNVFFPVYMFSWDLWSVGSGTQLNSIDSKFIIRSHLISTD